MRRDLVRSAALRRCHPDPGVPVAFSGGFIAEIAGVGDLASSRRKRRIKVGFACPSCPLEDDAAGNVVDHNRPIAHRTTRRTTGHVPTPLVGREREEAGYRTDERTAAC